MKLGLMQPYFFPYFGYFELISRVDKWVVFDTVKFSPQSWMTRNRILHQENGWKYIKICMKKAPDQSHISDVQLVAPDHDRRKILTQLDHYKQNAPFFKETVDVVREGLKAAADKSLVSINVSSMSAVCSYLGVKFDPVIASKENFEFPTINYAGQWALEISSLLGADEYINPPGGKAIFRPEEFEARNIKLAFTKLNEFSYQTPGYTFEPHLSIIDVMMWNSPETIRKAFKAQDLEYAW